jgi:hypothetical protein
MDRFYEVSDETKSLFKSILENKSLPVNVQFQFIGDSKLKTLIKVGKIPEDYSFILDKELKVTINEDLLRVYDEESIQILIEQEIDKIHINIDSGKIKLLKTDLNTFSGLVNKYGVEKITKANGVEVLYQQQKDDSNEFIA